VRWALAVGAMQMPGASGSCGSYRSETPPKIEEACDMMCVEGLVLVWYHIM